VLVMKKVIKRIQVLTFMGPCIVIIFLLCMYIKIVSDFLLPFTACSNVRKCNCTCGIYRLTPVVSYNLAVIFQ